MTNVKLVLVNEKNVASVLNIMKTNRVSYMHA